MGTRRFRTTGFTLLDVMITVTIIGILAAVTMPILTDHLELSKRSAAQGSYKQVRTALDFYYQQNQDWPETLSRDLFANRELVTMPRGWQLQYDPANGDLTLVELTQEQQDGAAYFIVLGE